MIRELDRFLEGLPVDVYVYIFFSFHLLYFVYVYFTCVVHYLLCMFEQLLTMKIISSAIALLTSTWRYPRFFAEIVSLYFLMHVTALLTFVPEAIPADSGANREHSAFTSVDSIGGPIPAYGSHFHYEARSTDGSVDGFKSVDVLSNGFY